MTWQEYRKAIAALLLAIGTWVTTAAPDGIDGAEWGGLLVALATGLGVAQISNAPGDEVGDDEGMTAIEALVVGFILIILAALLFGGVHAR